jgi:predicted phage terminase large subunit-like protein
MDPTQQEIRKPNSDGGISPELIKTLIADRKVRRAATKRSHLLFFCVYLGEYMGYATADFHREMFRLTESGDRLVALTAFRGSGKSTVFSLSYPIWAILGAQKKKFVLLVAQTQPQARLYLANLKRELEANALLRADLGPFEEKQEEWSAGTLVIPRYGARITAISTEQSIRGLRHGSHRPDLIICDDLEDLASVKTHESRSKTYQWLLGDVIPAGDTRTKVVVVGNMLHEESLLMRLKGEIESGARDGVFRAFPLLGEDGSIAWPGKFKTTEDIDALRRLIGDAGAWSREYLLKIISDSERVIRPEWLHSYDAITHPPSQFCELLIGVDVAISEEDSADYTAFVPIATYADKTGWYAYVLPNIINKRMTFPETVETLKTFAKTAMPGRTATILVEDVGYQRALAQQLNNVGAYAKAVSVSGLSKWERIALTGAHIEDGRFVFPKIGAEDLKRQLTGFGKERHDDVADAFTLAARHIIDNPPQGTGLIIL